MAEQSGYFEKHNASERHQLSFGLGNTTCLTVSKAALRPRIIRMDEGREILDIHHLSEKLLFSLLFL